MISERWTHTVMGVERYIFPIAFLFWFWLSHRLSSSRATQWPNQGLWRKKMLLMKKDGVEVTFLTGTLSPTIAPCTRFSSFIVRESNLENEGSPSRRQGCSEMISRLYSKGKKSASPAWEYPSHKKRSYTLRPDLFATKGSVQCVHFLSSTYAGEVPERTL